METVKLKELFEAKAFYNHCLYDLDVNQKNCILDIMQEACNQSIELCLNNAIIFEKCNFNEVHSENEFENVVDENYILKTKSQIENVPFLK